MFECWFPPLNLILGRHRASAQWLIDTLQASLTIDESQLDLFEPVVRYVHDLLHNNTGSRKYATDTSLCRSDGCWSMSIAGHSLGGGIASIVGSTLGIPSI